MIRYNDCEFPRFTEPQTKATKQVCNYTTLPLRCVRISKMRGAEGNPESNEVVSPHRTCL